MLAQQSPLGNKMAPIQTIHTWILPDFTCLNSQVFHPESPKVMCFSLFFGFSSAAWHWHFRFKIVQLPDHRKIQISDQDVLQTSIGMPIGPRTLLAYTCYFNIFLWIGSKWHFFGSGCLTDARMCCLVSQSCRAQGTSAPTRRVAPNGGFFHGQQTRTTQRGGGILTRDETGMDHKLTNGGFHKWGYPKKDGLQWNIPI